MYELLFVTASVILLSRPMGISAELPNGTCSAPIEGTLGKNLISEINDISEELTCKQRCQEEELCSLYTYQRANSTTSPETCYLLRTIGSPVEECADETCATGVPDCTGAPTCAYLVDGVIMEQGVKVTYFFGSVEKKISLIRMGECPLPIAVAVGGGGNGGNGGAGSGYVAHSILDLPLAPSITLVVKAGRGGINTLFSVPAEDSYVKFAGSDAALVTGAGGGDAGVTDFYDGGAGKNSSQHSFNPLRFRKNQLCCHFKISEDGPSQVKFWHTGPCPGGIREYLAYCSPLSLLSQIHRLFRRRRLRRLPAMLWLRGRRI